MYIIIYNYMKLKKRKKGRIVQEVQLKRTGKD